MAVTFVPGNVERSELEGAMVRVWIYRCGTKAVTGAGHAGHAGVRCQGASCGNGMRSMVLQAVNSATPMECRIDGMARHCAPVRQRLLSGNQKTGPFERRMIGWVHLPQNGRRTGSHPGRDLWAGVVGKGWR